MSRLDEFRECMESETTGILECVEFQVECLGPI